MACGGKWVLPGYFGNACHPINRYNYLFFYELRLRAVGPRVEAFLECGRVGESCTRPVLPAPQGGPVGAYHSSYVEGGFARYPSFCTSSQSIPTALERLAEGLTRCKYSGKTAGTVHIASATASDRPGSRTAFLAAVLLAQ
jgi:hypothetical protein